MNPAAQQNPDDAAPAAAAAGLGIYLLGLVVTFYVTRAAVRSAIRGG